MKYIKVFIDFADTLAPLGDAERGRLFTAMLEYARTGEVPQLTGNERFIWGAAKQAIDRQAEGYKKICEINRRNINSRYESLRTDTNRYEAVRTPTKNYESKQDKDKDEDKDKDGKKKKEKQSPACAKGVFEAYAGEDADLLAALQSFDAMRRKSKKPLTDRARRLLLAELDKLAGDNQTKIALLDQSIMHGWLGVYPLKNSAQPIKPQGGGNPFLDMLREEERRG